MPNTYPPHVSPADQIILFDGVCKLCNGWSRFIIRVDTRKTFKLCAVQSAEGQAILRWFGYSTDVFTTVLLVQGNRVLEKSDAALAVLAQLPAPWCCLRLFRLLPKCFRDWCYDRVALNRYQLFGKYDTCLLPSADHEARFFTPKS